MRRTVIVLIVICLFASLATMAVPPLNPLPPLLLISSEWHAHGANPKVPYYDLDIDGKVKNTTKYIYTDIIITIGIYDVKTKDRVRTMTGTIERLGPGETGRFCSGPPLHPLKNTSVTSKYTYKVEPITGKLTQ